jgi:glutathione S-transferase
MLTLFYSPAASSLAVHIGLEESDLPHHLVRVSTREGQTRTPEYLAINPLGQVPALRLDDEGEVLTQVVALLGYVADQAPQYQLLPTPPIERARALGWLAFFATSAHGAFRDWFRPEQCTSDEAAHGSIRRSARDRYFAHLRHVERALDARPWLLGDSYSLCDAYAYCFYLWGQVFEWPVAELRQYRSLAQRVHQRTATQRALAAEGFTGAKQLAIA